MSRLRSGINSYLLATLALLWVTGCASPNERRMAKEASTLRLYLEAGSNSGRSTHLVPVFRANPTYVRIQATPFLDEGDIVNAAVVDVLGGFAIQVRFDFHGALVLSNVTTAYRGRRIVVYSLFSEGRWLAAPMITRTLSNGVFTFTPDATRKEAERIVRGLNNVAAKLGNRPKPSKEDLKSE